MSDEYPCPDLQNLIIHKEVRVVLDELLERPSFPTTYPHSSVGPLVALQLIAFSKQFEAEQPNVPRRDGCFPVRYCGVWFEVMPFVRDKTSEEGTPWAVVHGWRKDVGL